MNPVIEWLRDALIDRYLFNPAITWVEKHTREARRMGLLWLLYKTRRLGNARYQRRVEFVAVCHAIPVLLKAFTEQVERAKAVRLALAQAAA